ncbi:PC-esterase domain-containing protein 1A-like isoform X1 [Haliotis cracherodii]|uniref:PC-esterase domain-containing protein 1A-like isoform X1 n=2 Tax=Haliotis cracherodii TaxID=6455 RepID=UPI0039E8B777
MLTAFVFGTFAVTTELPRSKNNVIDLLQTTGEGRSNLIAMGDIFFRQDVEKLLYNKFVVIIGDSIQRAVYKDLVLLLQKNRYLTDGNLRNKGEMTFEKDELIEGGKKGKMSNGTNYREVRQYVSDYYLIRFYFVCRCYNAYMESILADLSDEPRPDVVILNSCLWDISRYGVRAIDEYKENLKTLFRRFKEVLPADCLVIWNTTLPISKNARGGFIIPEIEFMNSTLRLDILEANYYAAKVVVENDFDVLDLHYFLRYQLHRRADDGIHWDMTAHRRMTNLLLTHISDAWGFLLPGNVQKNQEKNPEVFRFGSNTIPSRALNRQEQGLRSQRRPLNLDVNRMLKDINPMNINRGTLNRQIMDTNRKLRNDCGYSRSMEDNSYATDLGSRDNFQWQPYSNNNFEQTARHVDFNRCRYQPYNGVQRRRIRRQ